jgi:hypothetical protein
MATAVARVSPSPNAVEVGARALLLACLRTPTRGLAVAAAAASLDEVTWERFGGLAAEHSVRSQVREALTRHGNGSVPPSVSLALIKDCRRIAARLLFTHTALAGIVSELSAAAIPVIVLKGACLGTLVYRSIAIREMNDLDLLVPREHLQAAVDVLRAIGYEAVRPFSVAVDARVRHHIETFVNGTISVDVHWNITLPGQPYSIDPAELWARAVPLPVAGAATLRLCTEDLLLHLCVHTSYHHEFSCGLRPFCDIAAVIAHDPSGIDWDAVYERSVRWRWSKGVYVALTLAARLVGAEIPSGVLSRLHASDGADAVEWAQRLVWMTPAENRAFTPRLAAFGAHAAWSHTIRRALACLVPSPAELAWMYATRPGTPWLPVYYLRRVCDLVWRRGPSAMRLLAWRDRGVLALAERRDRLGQWLLDA